jgi:Ca2+-binding EF-hand superfamily protein
MSEDESQVQNEDLNSWFTLISKQSWHDIMRNNHDDLSLSYIDLIAEFATLLQISLRKQCSSHSSISESLLLMKSLKHSLPNSIDSLFSNSSTDDFQLPELKDNEELACNLFTRVLEIFNRNGRNVNDLYQDLDINKDGKIRFEELRTEFLKYDPSITVEESKAVFDILDGNCDGVISLHELTKRMKLIEEKAELERSDPLSCIVVSRPLDPAKIHGNLAVMLVKGESLKHGTHSVKIKLPGVLEYLTGDTMEVNPNWNFRADFFLENRTEDDLPLLVEVTLLNKNKVEGLGSFQWKKTMNTPNEFNLKVKVPIKTSTGQVRGSLHFQAMWTPINVRVYSEEEMQKLQALEVEILRHRKDKGNLTTDPELDDELFDLSDEEAVLSNQPSIVEKALEFCDKHNEKLDTSDMLEKLEEKPSRKSMQFEHPEQKEEIKEPIGRKSTRIQIHRRNSSYSYIMKVGTVTVQQEVVKKTIKQPSLPSKTFQIVVKNRKTVETKMKPVVLNS